jgi:hypothetical protein
VKEDAERSATRAATLRSLGFLSLDVSPAAMPWGLRALHAWLDSWHGIGLIERGLARQDRDLSLTRYGPFGGYIGRACAFDRAGHGLAGVALGRSAAGGVSGVAQGKAEGSGGFLEGRACKDGGAMKLLEGLHTRRTARGGTPDVRFRGEPQDHPCDRRHRPSPA